MEKCFFPANVDLSQVSLRYLNIRRGGMLLRNVYETVIALFSEVFVVEHVEQSCSPNYKFFVRLPRTRYMFRRRCLFLSPIFLMTPVITFYWFIAALKNRQIPKYYILFCHSAFSLLGNWGGGIARFGRASVSYSMLTGMERYRDSAVKFPKVTEQQKGKE